MILQRLISEAAKLPDLSTEVFEAQALFAQIDKKAIGFNELELMTSISRRSYTCENIQRRTVSLKLIETQVVKAKHAVTNDEDDFV